MKQHYIGLDWAQKNMAIARMELGSPKVHTMDVPANVKELQLYLCKLKGKRTLTLEETTTSQWLYTELRDCVDELIVCDPYRNRLLSEGAKTDRIDAVKLVRLLKAGMLKPVYHSGEQFIYLRKLVSGYRDVVEASVRAKNQRSAILRAVGKDKQDEELDGVHDRFVLGGIDESIELFDRQRERYRGCFEKLCSKHRVIRNLKSIPGIGVVGAVKIAAMVVDAGRFATDGRYWSYCGLVKLQSISGGVVYGKRGPRCCRSLKAVYMTAAMSVIRNDEGPLKGYYEHLINTKKRAASQARKALARKIASVSLAIMKKGEKFDARRLECSKT
jgi:transposase